jgi:hypothetical protein
MIDLLLGIVMGGAMAYLVVLACTFFVGCITCIPPQSFKEVVKVSFAWPAYVFGWWGS